MSARAVDRKAEVVATAAAAAAGVRIRELSDLSELQSVQRLFERVWRTDEAGVPITAELMRALTKAGNYVAGAYSGDELVGACAGFFGTPSDEVLHSHIAGVSPAVRRHVGFAVKLHQRAWALRRGIAVIEWTFDPLVSRNAYFNLGKLAATAAEYLPDFYGGLGDGINVGDESDRLLVRWRIDGAEVAGACDGVPRTVDAGAARAAGALVALDRSADGAAVPGLVEGDQVLGKQLTGTGRVTGFDRAGWYLVSRGTPASPRSGTGRSPGFDVPR
ncbi:GNAT family N-acetyltransferase [Amycolatopsis jiangsuensis]|uniref:Putative GNAT superfamily acetyltransferase n=1 Tax=Amycolatopsis jiangsuensis TaxID=1181879 RepID=A0A840IX98_9PSEU|nr:GNAT family N-acetyltransferase [Amycolatopsis jiangsuensis]MBB4685778.1 putative GNAT superfamily acetyltransferase [Amycolatopsis jiangsuensis]